MNFTLGDGRVAVYGAGSGGLLFVGIDPHPLAQQDGTIPSKGKTRPKWKSGYTVYDGPLEDEVLALDAHKSDVQVNLPLTDGRVAVYRTSVMGSFPFDHTLRFVGIDPFA